MAFSVEMPELGESVTEGTVTTWLNSVGDTVEVDEPLLEVSTDKVDTEIPSPVAGVLTKIIANEDETVEVGAMRATSPPTTATQTLGIMTRLQLLSLKRKVRLTTMRRPRPAPQKTRHQPAVLTLMARQMLRCLSLANPSPRAPLLSG